MIDYYLPLYPNLTYHIFNRANGDEKLFVQSGNYSYFLQKYSEYIHPIAETYAYCLIPNHFHFLIKIRDVDTLINIAQQQKQVVLDSEEAVNEFISQQFSNFFNSYSKAFNKQQNRKGSVFMERFKRKIVEADAYLSNLIHYIHHNPIHHGLAFYFDKWEWSSYRAFLSNAPSKIARATILDWFGGIENFMIYHQQAGDYGIISQFGHFLE